MTKHVFDCIDAHTCGNPVRLILSQKPNLAGSSMSQKRSDFIKNFTFIINFFINPPIKTI